MKFSSLVFLLVVLLFTLSAVAQEHPDPIVTSLTPTTGPETGGTSVAITGRHLGLPPNFSCILPCPAKVTFDQTTVTVDAETDTMLVVKTPFHSRGTVDVTVTTGDGRSVKLPSAFTYVDAIEAAYETFLLPIHLDGNVPGANGSLWATQVWIRNNGPNGITLAPWPCPPGQACPPVIPLTRTLNPGESLLSLPPFFQAPDANPSRLLFVSRDEADRLSVHLRLFDRSRSQSDAGAEIPVVREGDLFSSTLQLNGIPLSAAFRSMLRIYDLTRKDSQFRVRLYDASITNAPVPVYREFVLNASTPYEPPFNTEPAYAAFGGFNDFPQAPGIHPPALRIEVEPLTAGSRFWAFVSITNNDTQRVTLVTP